MAKNHDNKKIKPSSRAALDGIMAALAISLSYLESLLPDLPFMVPGAKLGLANVAVMFAVLALSWADALFIVAVKSGFAFLTRGFASFLMSFSGSLLSLIVLIILVKIPKKPLSYIFISVLSAFAHNMGQLTAASIYSRTDLFKPYFPALTVFAVISGIITGIILKTVMPAIKKAAFKN